MNVEISPEAEIFKLFVTHGRYRHGSFMCHVLENAAEAGRLSEHTAYNAKLHICNFIEHILDMIDGPSQTDDLTYDMKDLPALYTCLCKVLVYKKTGKIVQQYNDLLKIGSEILGAPDERWVVRDVSMQAALEIFNDWDNRMTIVEKFINQVK